MATLKNGTSGRSSGIHRAKALFSKDGDIRQLGLTHHASRTIGSWYRLWRWIGCSNRIGILLFSKSQSGCNRMSGSLAIGNTQPNQHGKSRCKQRSANHIFAIILVNHAFGKYMLVYQ
jgi:hypothetical protein